MPKPTKWYPYFSILADPETIREDIVALEKFLAESEHGDCLEINEDYRVVGAAESYEGPKGDGVTSDGDKINDGDHIITSEAKSICRTRHKDPDGYDFTIFTRTGSAYDVSVGGFSKDVIDDARAASK